MKTKYTAIYVRRSVSDKDKGNNSLSIAAQREECIRFVGEGADFKVYCDDGKSGKDVRHRPEFMQMMSDAKDGLIDRIIVKKYDRFSRNMREYLNITDELDRYGVGVISLSEPFNTETKEGRMMRNNLLNFAEFERETIAARVKDAYSTKAVETGFYQGGKMFFGFQSSRQTINGKTGWWVYTMPDNLKEAQVLVNNGNGAQYPGANVPGVFMEGKSKVLTGTTLSDYIPTGIGSVVTTPITNVFRVYTLDGRAINGVKSTTDLRKGVYIVNGRKLVVR